MTPELAVALLAIVGTRVALALAGLWMPIGVDNGE